MYEVNKRNQELQKTLKWLIKEYKKNAINGLLIIKTDKEGTLSLRSVYSSINEYEWVGILEHVKDMIKDAHYASYSDDA